MTLRELHERARKTLDPVVYDYVAGGAGEERVLAANERAFDDYALLPRVLRGSAVRDTAVDLPGARARRRCSSRPPPSTGWSTRTGSWPRPGPPRPRAPSW